MAVPFKCLHAICHLFWHDVGLSVIMVARQWLEQPVYLSQISGLVCAVASSSLYMVVKQLVEIGESSLLPICLLELIVTHASVILSD